MNPSKHSAICAEIQERSGKKETILRARIAELEAANAELLESLKEYIAAADNSMCPDDDAAAMLRFADADQSARAAIKKHGGAA